MKLQGSGIESSDTGVSNTSVSNTDLSVAPNTHASANSSIGPRIIVALDYNNASQSLQLAESLDPALCRLKVGKELFTACGPQVVQQLISKGFDIFLDLKFHDIPNTVAKAVSAAADLGVWMVNVHASGGERMMIAAREALHGRQEKAPLLIAVTVLTSMDSNDLAGVGINRSAQQQVLHLAQLSHHCGLDGVVCSALEAPALRQALGDGFSLVTPGIRLSDRTNDDQRRIVTPQAALSAGSTYLVIGRPITEAKDPAQACLDIHRTLVTPA